SIWRSGSSRNSASRSPSRRSAGSCAPWATANSRPDRATMRKRKARLRILKKLSRAPGGNRARQGARLRHDRNLVRRRGSHRPEEQDHPSLGEAPRPPPPPTPPGNQLPAAPYLRDAVCQKEGRAAALILPACNTEAMNLHLAEIAAAVAHAAHAILLVDQAGWHMSTRLVVPAN